MNLFRISLLGIAALTGQTLQAENRTMRTISSPPDYTVNGPLVSVIIPAYNEEKYLPDLLASLANQTYDNIEVIVVDNLSTDRTVEVATAAGALVATNTEYNISRSRNIGAAAASGEVFVFIDADTVPEGNLIERFVQGIEGGAVMVYPNKCATDDRLYSLGWILRGDIVGRPSSACIAVSRDVFYAAGGYNESCQPQENCSEERVFARGVQALGPTTYLRFNYAATSGRRLKAQGVFPPATLWDDRAYRQQVRSHGRQYDE